MSIISDNTIGRMSEIYARYEEGKSSYDLAQEYGLCHGRIMYIVRAAIADGLREKDLIAFAGDAVEALKKMPKRAYYMMRRNGIHNAESARALDRATVLKWRGCGDMIADEIMAFVEAVR